MSQPHDSYVVISADSHAGLPTHEYRDYLESKYLPQFDEFLAGRDQAVEDIRKMGTSSEDFANAWYKEHEVALRGGWEPEKRNKELDNDGVCGEVIFPDADAVESRTCAPFGTGLGLSGDLDPELGMAGARAHNRWLAELCKDSPERRRGVALVPITAEMPEVLKEIKRIKDDGLGGVMIPAMWMNQDPYHHKKYDQVWALCEDLQLPISTHSGPADKDSYDDNLGIFVTEVVWWPARPLWFMLWSGVFERFPGLRFGVTEAGCWWLPNLLWFWDRLYLGQKGAEKLGKKPFGDNVLMLPSEYVDRNCYIGASNTKRREIGMRYEIGLTNICWGNDFPHPEGTWPLTRDWITKTFKDVPIEETRQMLGTNIAEIYNFDLKKLQPLAETLAVTPESLGQVGPDGTDSHLVAKWADTKAVGRHWLTDHEFPLIKV